MRRSTREPLWQPRSWGYFAFTSQSGLWTFDEMRSWQVAAGLVPRKSISLVPGGGFVLQVAERSES